MSKFKVGDKVRVVISDELFGLYKGSVHTVVSVYPMGNIEIKGVDVIQWSPDRFELVQEDTVLTPKEVFEHLRKGTKLQYRRTASSKWVESNLDNHSVKMIILGEWRIKPEPEIIELNGKKYREIIE